MSKELSIEELIVLLTLATGSHFVACSDCGQIHNLAAVETDELGEWKCLHCHPDMKEFVAP